MFNPKKDDNVLVCYDGKISRGVDGRVIARRGFAVQVEFKRWCESETDPVKVWFVRINEDVFGGYLRTPDSLMHMMFGKKCPGDWYSVGENPKGKNIDIMV